MTPTCPPPRCVRRAFSLLALFSLLLFPGGMAAATAMAAEKPLTIQKVTEGVYALVGEMAQRSPANLGNNATFGVVITQEGVLLVDPGGSWRGAEQIDQAIQSLTDRPVTHVINSGGQDHRWLGNGYWQAKGAEIIASQAAVNDQQERASMQLSRLRQLLGGEALAGTEPVHAQTVFESDYSLSLGGLSIAIHHPGPAHTPGDSFVWVPEKQTVFTGDIVYVERLLGVGPQSHSGDWIKAFQAMAALQPTHLVPGHGHATTLSHAEAETLAYLTHLRGEMRTHIDGGGDIIGSVEVDQSPFKHLKQFDALAGRNAQQVFTEMEWE